MDPRALWRGRAALTIFDARYDEAAFEALCEAWQADPQRSECLHVIALSDAALPGFRRVPQADARITLDLLGAAPLAALADLDALIDAADLRDLPVDAPLARALARLCAPGAVVTFNNADGTAARSLAEAGFTVNADAPAAEHRGQTRGVCPQPGAAAAVSSATYTSRKPPRPRTRAPQRRALVIGAGVAGCAASERLCARGWHVTLLERHAAPAMEASGNLAGIFMPLLSIDDNIPTRLARAAYLYALDYWQRIGGMGDDGAIDGARCGVLQLARDGEHARVQRAIAQAHAYPRAYAEWLEASAASALAGSPAPDGGWHFPQGGWARPASVCAAMLAACGERLVQRFGVGDVSLHRLDGQWQARSRDGAVLADAPVVVVASGAGAAAIVQTAALPLAAVRGQVTHLAAGAIPALPLVICREAYVTPASHGLHSAGASYDIDPDPALSAASHDANLTKLRSLLGDAALVPEAPLRGRVGFRSVAPDRLPLVGALPDAALAQGAERLRDVPRHAGLFGLLGYASRGLIWAPLAAEMLAAQLDGEALPLEAPLAAALDPARFVLRARRQQRGGDAPLPR
jgi:tRNA 5-methylaminomethyl-2-thiouridine biosynthesis bifunctional protein